VCRAPAARGLTEGRSLPGDSTLVCAAYHQFPLILNRIQRTKPAPGHPTAAARCVHRYRGARARGIPGVPAFPSPSTAAFLGGNSDVHPQRSSRARRLFVASSPQEQFRTIRITTLLRYRFAKNYVSLGELAYSVKYSEMAAKVSSRPQTRVPDAPLTGLRIPRACGGHREPSLPRADLRILLCTPLSRTHTHAHTFAPACARTRRLLERETARTRAKRPFTQARSIV